MIKPGTVIVGYGGEGWTFTVLVNEVELTPYNVLNNLTFKYASSAKQAMRKFVEQANADN